jgi:hypothetical protein
MFTNQLRFESLLSLQLKRQYGADALHSLKLQIPALGPLGGGFDI